MSACSDVVDVEPLPAAAGRGERRRRSRRSACGAASSSAGTSTSIRRGLDVEADRRRRSAPGRAVRRPRPPARRAGRPCRTRCRSSARRRPGPCRARPARAASSAAACSTPRACPGSPGARSRAARARSRRRRRGRGRRCGRGSPRSSRTRPPGRGARSRCGDAAAGLIDRAAGREVAAQHGDAAARRRRGSRRGRMTSRVPDRRVVEVVDQRLAGDGQRRRVEQVADLGQHGEQPAGAVEVLHQEPAGRQQVDQHAAPASRSGRSRRGSARCRAARRSPAGGRRRWWTRRSRPAPRSRCRTTPGVRNVLGRRPAATSSTASRPVACAASSSRLSGAGRAGDAGDRPCRAPRRPGAIVDAVPMVLQCPRLRIIADSDRGTASAESVPARTSSRQPPHVGAAAQRHPAERAGQHRPAGDDDGGQVDRRRGHEQRRDRLVAAAEQHEPVDRVGPEHLLHRHRGEVAPEHRGRPDLRLAQATSPAAPAAIPPAAWTPSRTAAATSVRCMLHGMRSEAVFAIAICGRP